ncbi:helix-turn-helix domain-containing protein [Corynebacterium terpenotabidum]|uniref:Uncharacterized protein n=1 Tax=Corynebacterium terpenotabidum Y-11 TaxID=1200352 RepID=S4XHI8_9CORY|nr:helix-turn-helix domain-containing protein [Corynebacterium terpenotabidum]AGP30108.1 hypothetical protein A606_02275 [Corynebacterium terpenotabidum Y-11]
MSRVPPIKQEIKRTIREKLRDDVQAVGKRTSQRLALVDEAVSTGSGDKSIASIRHLMKAEEDLARMRRRMVLMLYSAGATPRQIAEEMGRHGHPMDHQTVYRWVTRAVEEGGMTMAEIRESPKH